MIFFWNVFVTRFPFIKDHTHCRETVCLLWPEKPSHSQHLSHSAASWRKRSFIWDFTHMPLSTFPPLLSDKPSRGVKSTSTGLANALLLHTQSGLALLLHTVRCAWIDVLDVLQKFFSVSFVVLWLQDMLLLHHSLCVVPHSLMTSSLVLSNLCTWQGKLLWRTGREPSEWEGSCSGKYSSCSNFCLLLCWVGVLRLMPKVQPVVCSCCFFISIPDIEGKAGVCW